jgi:alpha-L-fucosidase
MRWRNGLVLAGCLMLAAAGVDEGRAMHNTGMGVTEDAEQIRLSTPELEAAFRKRGYVSGVAAGSFVDRKTGFHDAGFGLDIVDWIMEPGSDETYRDKLDRELVYQFGNLYHGNRPKRSIEGPQICTQARAVSPEVIRGRDFVAVKTRYRYRTAAPGKKTGSLWEQTLVFPAGKRYFLSSDRITTVNGGAELFLRLDMPGHIKHTRGDTFSEVYLSYAPGDRQEGTRIPSSAFSEDFAPDARHLYVRDPKAVPKRFIRAYRLRDPKTGAPGPWLAGMTLNPAVVHEAWCHQRGYICMIEEFGLAPGQRALKPGESFSAAFLVGYFDSIEEMHQVYDEHAGHTDLRADAEGYRLLKRTAQPSASRVTPESRLARRLEWFQDQKFGLFVHWGIYSQWGCIESWPLVEADTWARPDDLPAWTERGKDISRFRTDYWALNRTFNPGGFHPEEWARAAKRAGMKYFVFTTKHHDGFSMWDTRQTEFRVTGPDCPYRTSARPDIVRDAFEAFRKEGFGIGAYFSKADWHHPDYWSPDPPAKTRNPNYDTLGLPHRWARFREFVHSQVSELMSGYGPIDILWLDAGQVRPPRQDLDMDRLAKMARGYQPGLLVVDRTVGGPHENYRTPEQEVPAAPLPYVWESCITMGDQWSFKPHDRYKSPRRLIHLLVDVVAKGGNLLLNIGPDADGRFPPEALQRLEAIGDWMAVNGEAIHGTRAFPPYKQGQVAFTRKGRYLYATYLAADGEEAPPVEVTLSGITPRPGSRVRMLGVADPVRWTTAGATLTLQIPTSTRSRPPCREAWVFRIEPAAGEPRS